MDANYNSSAPGALYRRFDVIRIEYPTALTAAIIANETDAVKTNTGEVLKVRDTRTVRVDVAPADFSRVLQLVDPTTGAAIPNATMTVQQVMLGILAFLREKQDEMDAAE